QSRRPADAFGGVGNADGLELVGADGEDLHVVGDSLAKREAILVDPQTRPHAAHLGIRLVGEFERDAIVPDEPEDFVAVALQRLAMDEGVVQWFERWFPSAGLSRVVR